MLCSDEFGDGFRDACDLLRAQLRVHGQRNYFFSGVFRVGKIAVLVAERSVERLQV